MNNLYTAVLAALRFDVQVAGEAIPWESPQYVPWEGGVQIERRAFWDDGSHMATLTLRCRDGEEAVAFWCEIAALPKGGDFAYRGDHELRIVVQHVECHLWDRRRRFSKIIEKGSFLIATLQDPETDPPLLAGQALRCGGVLWLTPEGEVQDDGTVVSHAKDWWSWVKWGCHEHPLLYRGGSWHTSYAASLTREQDRLTFPDQLHRAIFGMLEQPGATGAQNDLCWIPGLGYESEMRQSVWQEGCRPTHWYDELGHVLASVPDKTVYWNGRPVGHDETGAPSRSRHGWRGHDRQHYSLNYLCALAAVCDDPLVWLEVRHQVELWIANHPVSSGTPKDSLDSPRAVGRAMAAGVKLWLLTKDERLREQILRRADRVHAVLSEHMQQRVGVMEYDTRTDFASYNQDIDYPLGERTGDFGSTPLGPLLEVRGPDPRALNVDHWRPWEEATAAIGMAMVASVFNRPQDYWTSAVLALHVMQHGYRVEDPSADLGLADGQIAFAMAWPTPAKQDLRPGVNVAWADGTDFRTWCRAAVQWVEFLTKPESETVRLTAEMPSELIQSPNPLHEQAKALLALSAAPSDPVRLAEWERWSVDWGRVSTPTQDTNRPLNVDPDAS